MRKWVILLLLFLLPAFAAAEEGPYLTSEVLRELQPAYEAFLNELVEQLISHGLLPEDDRQAWINYQMGDYLQSGGYGSITALYTPGLLELSDESVALKTFSLETEAGTLRLNTLNRYSLTYSPLPGLPLDDIELIGEDGALVDCRYRWVAPHGTLLIWDGVIDELVNVGATYINTGKTLFWSAETVDGVEESLTLEILAPDEDRTLAALELLVISGPNCWSPESLIQK